MHNAYEAFLELDSRAEATATEFLAEKVTDLLHGAKAFIKKTEETSESLGNKFVKTFSDLFGFGKKEADEDEEVIDLSVSKEVAVHTLKSSQSNIVKTVEAGSNDSIEQVDNEYQTIMDQLITAKKVICFSNVMQVTKAVSSCLIRKPFEQVSNDNKMDCESLDVIAKNAMAQCDYIFPFATNSDNVINDFLSKASRVELNIYENGQTGLKSHVDEVVSDLTKALGEAVVQQYKLLPAVSNQDVMQAEYEKNVYDVSFSQDNTNNAILLGNSNHDTPEL